MRLHHRASHQHGLPETWATDDPADKRPAGTAALAVSTGRPFCHLRTSLIHVCGSEVATDALPNRSAPVAPWLLGQSEHT